MKIFAISDLHLATTTDKPMDIFGGDWDNYWEKIKQSWNETVTEGDVVLIAGDISWAMKQDDALADLSAIDALPGKKVIIRGNHDYWWSSYSKVKAVLPSSIVAIQNDAQKFGKYVICGTRGWGVPTQQSTPQDIVIYDRENIRLALTLAEAQKLRKEGDVLILMMHYPPFNRAFDDSGFTDIITANNVDMVVYGHLHGTESRTEMVVNKKGIPYYLTSCDKLKNQVKLLADDQFNCNNDDIDPFN